jgi:Leucine rich repeat
VKLFVIVAFFASQIESVTFECTYSVEDWVILDKVYGCSTKAVKIEAGDRWEALTKVSKNHNKGKKNEDVIALNVENGTMHRIPKSIEKFFPSLQALRISKVRLQSIASDDLKAFPGLKVLCLWANELKTLDGNLLAYTPDLEFMNFGSNQITHIGPNFFAPLTKLVAAYFEENTCINNTLPFGIDEVKFEIAVKCPASFDMVEIALINGKLASKNDEFENKIKLLENRIDELELHAKK